MKKFPFFIEATEDNIDSKLIENDIINGNKLPPPYIGYTKDEGIVCEMFMHSTNGKKGYMVHLTSKRIKNYKK